MATIVSSIAPDVDNSTRPVPLRSTCNSCADAKIGCTKEKPTCQRCAKRNEPCVYAATKRAGRPPHRNRRATNHDNLPKSISSTTRPSSSGLLHSPLNTQYSDDSPMTSDDLDFAAALGSTDLTSPLGMLPSLGDDFEQFLASLSPIPALPGLPGTTKGSEVAIGGNTAADALCVPNDASTGEAMQLDRFDGTDSVLLPGRFYDSPSPSSSSLTTGITSKGSPELSTGFSASAFLGSPPTTTRPPTGPPLATSFFHCDCHRSGLSLLCRAPPLQVSESIDIGIPLQRLPTFRDVMRLNRTAAETVDKILACPANHQDSLLLILSLVTLQTMGWYAAAACSAQDLAYREGSSNERADLHEFYQLVQPLSPEDYGQEADGESLDRIACNLVLSEICNVQRVVNVLSGKILAAEKKTRQAKSIRNENCAASTARDLLFNGLFFNPSISTLTSAGLGQTFTFDLKSRVRELSRGIMRTLSEA